MQRTIPPTLEIRARVLRLPVALRQRIAGRLILIGQELDQFTLAVSAIKRRYKRLNEAHRAIERTRVAPLLKVVRSVEMPVAIFRGLILVKTQVNSQSDFVQRA